MACTLLLMILYCLHVLADFGSTGVSAKRRPTNIFFVSILQSPCHTRNSNVNLTVFSGNSTQLFGIYHKVGFYIHGSVHHESNLAIVQQDATVFSLLHFCRQLYMFRVLTPIISSWYSCNYSFWY